jgi:hypothetical protein
MESDPAPRPWRPRLAGTSHQPGWTLRKRSLRAQLKEAVAAAPPEKGGSERALLETIDSAHLLSPRALRVYREMYAELVKISQSD